MVQQVLVVFIQHHLKAIISGCLISEAEDPDIIDCVLLSQNTPSAGAGPPQAGCVSRASRGPAGVFPAYPQPLTAALKQSQSCVLRSLRSWMVNAARKPWRLISAGRTAALQPRSSASSSSLCGATSSTPGGDPSHVISVQWNGVE